MLLLAGCRSATRGRRKAGMTRRLRSLPFSTHPAFLTAVPAIHRAKLLATDRRLVFVPVLFSQRETNMTDQEQIADPIEAVAFAYLSTAEGNPSLALRLVIADAVVHLGELGRAVVTADGLISRGFARGRSLLERSD